MFHSVAHFFGFDPGQGNGSFYLFWSGAGSDIAELSILGWIYITLRRYNCHAAGCWRIGRHPVEGTTYTVCRKHHPEGKPAADLIRHRYHLYLGDRPGRG